MYPLIYPSLNEEGRDPTYSSFYLDRGYSFFDIGSPTFPTTSIAAAGTSLPWDIHCNPIVGVISPQRGYITPDSPWASALPISFVDDLERTSKIFGLGSPVIGDFFDERHKELAPLFEKSGKIESFVLPDITNKEISDFPDIGKEIVSILKRLVKIKQLFKSYVINKVGERKTLSVTYYKTVDFLQEIYSFEYFKSKLN